MAGLQGLNIDSYENHRWDLALTLLETIRQHRGVVAHEFRRLLLDPDAGVEGLEALHRCMRAFESLGGHRSGYQM
jgi:hypothetical protein